MSHKDEGLKTRHRQYWKKLEADSVVLDPGIIAISWEDSTIRLHDGYTIGGRIFPMAPAPSLTVNVLTPLSGNGSVSSPISLNIAALANQVPVLANAPITGHGVTGDPLALDLVALAAALANTVPVAHDASLVGNGTVGAPLSVNWGLAPQQPVSHNGTLSGAGTVASPLAVVPSALASLVAVSAISPITGDGKVATPLTLDIAALLPQLHNKVTVVTDGVTVTGSGTTANPLVAVPAVATVVTASPITGNGTLANPIDINIVSAIAEISAAGGVPVVHNASLTGQGTTASPLNVDWSQMPALNVQHDGSMTGQGTAGNPLSVNWASAPAINVQHDGTMTGSGTAGSPLSVNGLALASQVPVSVNAGLSGNGTAGSPIAINPGVLGPLLSGLVPIAVSAPLTGVGTAASPLGITNASGALRGVVQLATGAEGLQPANDSDAATPAYIAAAIAAIPGDKYLASVGAYNAATNVFNLNMSDGSVVPVDLTAAVADSVASVPNKHVPAVVQSPNGSIVVAAGGTDNQLFSFDTNAGIIPIADAGNHFVATNVEAALAELALAIPVLNYATTAEIQAGHPNKIVTADDLAAAFTLGIDHRIHALTTTTDAIRGYVNGTNSVNAIIGVAEGTSVRQAGVVGSYIGTGIGAGAEFSHYGLAGSVGNAVDVARLGVTNGNGVDIQHGGTGGGVGINANYTGTGLGYAGSFNHAGNGIGDTIYVTRFGTTNGNAIYAYNGAAAGSAIVAVRDTAGSIGGGHNAIAAFFNGNKAGNGISINYASTGTGYAMLVDKSSTSTGAALNVLNNSADGDGITISQQNSASPNAGIAVYSAGAYGMYTSKDPAATVAGSVIFTLQSNALAGSALEAVMQGGAGGTWPAASIRHLGTGMFCDIGTATAGLALYTNGNITAVGGFTPSDERKKTIKTRIENAREVIGNARGVLFYWNEDTFEYESVGNKLNVGVIAQDFVKTAPELLFEAVDPTPRAPQKPQSPRIIEVPEMDKNRFKDKDAHAKAVKSAETANANAVNRYNDEVARFEKEYAKYERDCKKHVAEPRLNVDYGKLVAYLIEDNNGLSAKIDEQEQRIAKLEALVNKLTGG